MEPLQTLETAIAGFPGYADDTSRERCDEFVRSYLGEALASAQSRLAPLPTETESQLQNLLFRVGFTNQAAYQAYEEAARDRTDFSAMAAADAAVVELAAAAPTVSLDDLPEYLNRAGAVLDSRDRTMAGGAVSYT
jgi:hypothetical protein